MKKIALFFFMTAVALCSVQVSTKSKVIKKAKLAKTQIDTVSYATGIVLGSDLQKMLVSNFDNKINIKVMLRGFNTVVNGDSTFLPTEKADSILKLYIENEQKKKDAAWKIKNDKFLADNAKVEGVTSMTDGLQYKVISVGSGEKPGITDTVEVNYKGSLVDGREFDNSYRRGKPAEFPVKGVISGFSEGLQQMNVGSKYILYIPSAIGYGARQLGPIPGNSTLIFEVELINLKHAVAKSAESITTPAVDKSVTVAPADKKSLKSKRNRNKK